MVHPQEAVEAGIRSPFRRSPRVSRKRPSRFQNDKEDDDASSGTSAQRSSPSVSVSVTNFASLMGCAAGSPEAAATRADIGSSHRKRARPSSPENQLPSTRSQKPMVRMSVQDESMANPTNLGPDDGANGSMDRDKPARKQSTISSPTELSPQAFPDPYSNHISQASAQDDQCTMLERTQSFSSPMLMMPKVLNPSSSASTKSKSNSDDVASSTPPSPFSHVNDENARQIPRSPGETPRRSVIQGGLKDTPNNKDAGKSRPRVNRSMPSPLQDPSSMALEKPLQLLPSTAPFTAANVVNHACQIFPDPVVAVGIRELPCVSARLFACFSLRQDALGSDSTTNVVEVTTGGIAIESSAHATPRTRRRRQSLLQESSTVPRNTSVIYALLPLLKVMVELELMTLSAGIAEENHPAMDKGSTKRVHFAGFDGSSMKPPVDVLPGSNHHQQECVQKLQQVLDEAHRLQEETGPTLSSKMTALDSLVCYLRNLSDDDAQACAGSLQWPKSRVLKAAELYRYDLEILWSRLLADESPTTPKSSSDWEEGPKLLLLEQRLADSCGQFIRHYLRNIFNPVPSRARIMLASPENYPRRISEMLTLQSLSNPNSAVDGESLSSLISYALRDVHEALGSLALLDDSGNVGTRSSVQRLVDRTTRPYDSNVMSKLGGYFETTGNAGKAAPVAITRDNFTDQEWDGVFSYVRNLGDAVAAFHGARFLHELWAEPGVADSLQHGDQSESWSSLQSHASMLSKGTSLLPRIGLTQTWAKPEDAHLSVLGQLSSNDLFARLSSVMSLLEPHVEEWEDRLDVLVKMSEEAAKSCSAPPPPTKSRRASDRRRSIISPRKQSPASIFHSSHRNEFGVFATLVDEAKQRSVFFPHVLPCSVNFGSGEEEDDDDDDDFE